MLTISLDFSNSNVAYSKLGTVLESGSGRVRRIVRKVFFGLYCVKFFLIPKAPDMIKIQLVTLSDWILFKEATLLITKEEPITKKDLKYEIPGQFEEDRWTFEFSENGDHGFVKIQFLVCNKIIQSPQIDLDLKDNETYVYYASQFPASQWTRLGPIPDFGQINSREFDIPPSERNEPPFDVIVIGSGMAGGVLAEHLSDKNVRTLVLEAGGVPLETHIANLPRPHRSGFQKHVWQRWYDFRAKNYDDDAVGNNYTDGFQGYNLGGRSVFWGGFIPRMTSAELDFWPQQLKWDLEDRYYPLAEELMGLSTAPSTHYSRSFHRLLRQVLPDYTHLDAPVAVRPHLAGSNAITTGMFSTADLLLESYRTRGMDENDAFGHVGNQSLFIRTHQEAIHIKPGKGIEPSIVTTRDIRTGKENVFKGNYVVLSCGCIESARLAKRSGLGNEYVGVGVTDHPIAWTHFEIPPFSLKESSDNSGDHVISSSPFYDRYGTVKTVSQAINSENHEGIYNVLIELGADFNQGRNIDPEIFQQSVQKNSMLCEIVFLTNMELVEGNHLVFQEEKDFRPQSHVKNPGLSSALRQEINAIRDKIIEALGGKVLDEAWGDGSLGFVAHEVGGLRMEVKDSNNIGKKLQSQLDGVVNEYGKLLNEDRIYVCDLSIFPTSPAANPSLTAVAMAIRLGDELSRLIKR